MKNKFYFTIVLLFTSIATFSQTQPVFQWAKQIGGWPFAKSIAVDDSGNVYSAGQFAVTTDFDPDTGVFNMSTLIDQWGGFGTNIYILKLDRLGNFVWAKSFGGVSYPCQIGGIALDKNQNVYVTGVFYGEVDFDPGPSIYNLGNTLSRDCFVLKLNKNGNFIWAKNTLRDAGERQSNAIKVDRSGNVYTCGSFFQTGDFDPDSTAIYNLSSGGYSSPYISKLDANGNFIWAKTFAGGQYSNAIAMDIDTMDNVYTTGFFMRTTDFDPGSAVFDITPITAATLLGEDAEDVFISKLDSNGNFVWAKSFGGDLLESGKSIKVDNNQNVFVGGVFRGNTDFDPDSGLVSINYSGGWGTDGFICKLDLDGHFVWGKKIGGPSSIDEINEMDLDANNNIYATGVFALTADFDPDLTIYNLTATTANDIFIAKLNSAGNFAWAYNMGGIDTPFGNDDSGKGIAIDADFNVYGTGWFDGTIDFDPGINSYDLTSSGVAGGGQMNAYLFKWNQGILSGINTIANPDDIIIYPNPNNGGFKIKTNNLTNKATIQVYDINAKKIFEDAIFPTSKNEIHLKNIVPGIFLIKIFDGDKSYSKKLIVE